MADRQAAAGQSSGLQGAETEQGAGQGSKLLATAEGSGGH